MREPLHREGVLSAVAMLVSGTFSTVIMKTEYGMHSHGTATCLDAQTGEETTLCPFDKPWFGVLQMKVAMTLCLAFLYVRKCSQHRDHLETPVLRMLKNGRRYVSTAPSEREMAAIKHKYAGHAEAENKVEAFKQKYRPHRNGEVDEMSPLLGSRVLRREEDQQESVSLRTMVAIALPSLLDLLQTVLANVGLLWISSSVYQMARGSIIIFSAFFSVRLMSKKLYGYHYASMATVMLAVALVGYAGVGHHPDVAPAYGADSFNSVLGLFFIIVAQVLCALQIIVEEHMMLAMNVSPMLLVGFEGLWGLAFYVILVPILTLTPATGTAFARTWHEDFVDSFVQVKNSPTLMVLILAYIVTVGTLNVTGNYVTKHLSAVMRSITETLRTLGVWLLSLLLYYVVQWQGSASPGEQWTTYSWLELLGFLLMVYGTLAYKQLIHIPVSKLYAAEQRELRRDHLEAVKSPFMGNMHK
ncbi:Drug/Metabolite Transporter [Phytophthora megakarya]|uniref:Drug/Metabolite Transporter n=1 Tax=Phytophthora megakarya TaxID=4795 RepID=A0A225WE79_9STRA|nr:Drug/Metabolite Transporter [Phytophthora megakarya]